MPRSQQPKEAEGIVVELILQDPDRRILDVGCGDGKWSDLLFDKVHQLDGVEIWPEYVRKYNLIERYDRLFVADVMSMIMWNLLQYWDVIILGDVLEHLTKENGWVLLNEIKANKSECFLIIPIAGEREQDGSVYGNPYETHVSFWSHSELTDFGFQLLHEGTNPNGLVTIGTYRYKDESNGGQSAT